MKVSGNESIEARIREINGALQILGEILAKRFGELTLYERLSARYLTIQLVESAASICIQLLSNLYSETVGVPRMLHENRVERRHTRGSGFQTGFGCKTQRPPRPQVLGNNG
ncbi:MAG: hypothetical protein QXQ11_07305 [Candidatus Bathyarchaeia archaeon]